MVYCFGFDIAISSGYKDNKKSEMFLKIYHKMKVKSIFSLTIIKQAGNVITFLA